MRTSQQSWILTSATLSVGGSFGHAVSELGLEGIETAHFPSPFDFASQVSAWIPPLVAAPGTTAHTAELVERCLPLLTVCTGRTFMLFTTYRALRQAASMLAEYPGLSCLVQGTASRARLLEQFRQIDGAVLLATQSFWEGVDVRGGELRLLIVDKLPFPSPEQPLTRARTRAIEAAGGNGFSERYLPEAITRLRQGFGRLIREENDAGLFVFGDTRVRTRRYGRVVLESLPAIRWLDDADGARAYLESLA
ncbi:MAG: helicase C-terminal domain-containing protein [Gammaproteobacteria bacterium]|nr:helicase C-terminal domain-containing protein [Gammaproteobacteria bacterium]